MAENRAGTKNASEQFVNIAQSHLKDGGDFYPLDEIRSYGKATGMA